MHISVKWFNDQFNINLASKEGADDFLSIKGCRIVQGKDGPFVSMPATKNQQTGKFWNHAWCNEKFGATVLALAKGSQPKEPARQEPAQQDQKFDDDIPF